MKKIFLMIVFILIPVTIFAQENSSFKNEKEAAQAGCKIIFLKNTQYKSCVLGQTEGNELSLAFYDQDSSGAFQYQQNISISSWYLEAKFNFIKVFEKGPQFIAVEFEGNTGTGVIQKVYLLIGWNQNHFEAAFLENKNYMMNVLGNETVAKTDFQFHASTSPELLLQHSYHQKGKDIKRIDKKWSETLRWNPKNFSFYNEKEETSKIKVDSLKPGQDLISQARIKFLKEKPNLENLKFEYLEKIGASAFPGINILNP